MGLTRTAMVAGITPASAPTSDAMATPMNAAVRGYGTVPSSMGNPSTSSTGICLTVMIDSTTPITPATVVATTDSRNTEMKIRAADAPIARRMPISRTRWPTVTIDTVSRPSAPSAMTMPPTMASTFVIIEFICWVCSTSWSAVVAVTSQPGPSRPPTMLVRVRRACWVSSTGAVTSRRRVPMGPAYPAYLRVS